MGIDLPGAPPKPKIKLCLGPHTVPMLNLNYTPHHWENSGKFLEGVHVRAPWGCAHDTKWYRESLLQFNSIQDLLKPYTSDWVEAQCTAALIPTKNNSIDIFINGKTFIFPLGSRLIQRMKRAKMDILVTTTNALISGGGEIIDGKLRSYFIGLDIKPFRNRL